MKILRPALSLFILLSLITGIVYPFAITGIGQLLFPLQANGSLMEKRNVTIGARLIGQSFTKPQYFWGRPSATSEYPYNAMASGSANIAPSNPALITSAQGYADRLIKADPQHNPHVPIDLVTHSSSGLDPHISIAGALYQVPRVAKARGLSGEQVKAMINKYKQIPLFGVIGEPVINVLQLNLALDTFAQTKGTL
ncbi:potassium-transporting ATPase subunit KdpC [Commensalibacter nepenthis]|uniref:Potassium-transporting ATPase KdpC subunit n=1 Tax=Commensalibacter nepenthis TaxID=3043872 RepID=A0ABT6Q4Y3_9PROT|nr:potassium-transporting ATPase subunit KdpC [Commensalibacter sp. TBRC 10068]MDI2111802.1 potassium-transporting ATPase subunit KdpC [Commensalibacter sp. TBRC 10068]